MTRTGAALLAAEEAARLREERKTRLGVLADQLRTSQDATEALQEENYAAWDEVHGPPAEGGLSYAEIAAATGTDRFPPWSRGWIILGLRKWRENQEASS